MIENDKSELHCELFMTHTKGEHVSFTHELPVKRTKAVGTILGQKTSRMCKAVSGPTGVLWTIPYVLVLKHNDCLSSMRVLI